MTNINNTDKQVIATKSFIQKTWKPILAIIVVCSLSFLGFKYWQDYQIQQLTLISDKYEQISSKIKIKDLESANELADFAFENDHIYGVLAGLKATKFFVDYKKDYEGAEKLLLNARTKESEEFILTLINLRLARIQIQLEKYDDSLATLEQIKSKYWNASINDVKADVYVKLKQYDKAISAYKAALESNPIPEMQANIKIKLNQAEYLKLAE